MSRATIEEARYKLSEVMALLDIWLESNADIEPILILYSQRDPQWRDVEYTPGHTFGASGCLVTAVTMITSYAGYIETPPEVAAKLRGFDCFVGGDLLFPQKIPAAYPKLAWQGRVDWRDEPADIPALLDYVDQCPTIVEVDAHPGGAQPPDDQHFVVAIGYTEDKSDLWIADPWDGSETLLLERYALTHWDLARAVFGVRLLRVLEKAL